MSDRRSFVAWLGSLPLVGRPRPLGAVPPIVIDATPTALYQQPDGRNKDRKSTRLNSSHSQISYAVFCLKKKKRHNMHLTSTKHYDPLDTCTHQYYVLPQRTD